jgi:hypothetical protein
VGGGGRAFGATDPGCFRTLRIHYQRSDANFTPWGLHLWDTSRIDAARQYDERATVDGMKRPIFPKGGVADKVLATAAREDLYHLPVQKSREVIMPEGLELYPIVFYLDKVAMGRNNLHVRGWMLTLREVSLDLQPHLQLVQGDRSYLFRGSVERRPDVARAHPDRLDALRSGF